LFSTPFIDSHALIAASDCHRDDDGLKAWLQKSLLLHHESQSYRMRAVVQRVSRAKVTVAGEVSGEIGTGLLVLLGVADDDASPDAEFLADKLVGLRIFPDDEGKMNRSLADIAGAMLVVSQFTLLGDCRKGKRPSFIKAARPEAAVGLYNMFVAEVRGRGITVATGRFQEHMDVELVNDGPVTLLVDSRKEF
jgi:D-tyrosyl-tRNA(Tyr) deacylase